MSRSRLEPMAVLLLLMCLGGICHARWVRLETDEFAERDGAAPDSLIARGEATNLRTVQLNEGESVFLTFCVPGSESQVVEVADIVWSNDGPQDTVNVTVDDQDIGEFTTHNESREGQLWNSMRRSGPIGAPLLLVPGNHTLVLHVTQSDSFGLEVDNVLLGIDGNYTISQVLCDGIGQEAGELVPDEPSGTEAPASNPPGTTPRAGSVDRGIEAMEQRPGAGGRQRGNPPV